MRSPSITTRLAATIILVLLGGGIVVMLAALAYGRQASDEAYDKLLAGAAFEISRAIAVADGKPFVDLPVAAFEILALAQDDRVFYRVMTEEGITLTGYETLPAPTSMGATVAFYDGEIFASKIRLASVTRRMAEPGYSGNVRVIVAQTTGARSALAWNIAQKALVLLLVSGGMLVVLAMVAVASSLQPLRRIERILRRRESVDLTPLEVAAPREVEAMVGAINHFMSRLARRVDAMQNMIADATHQLRTPIAALRAQAELASDETDPEQLRQIIKRIHQRTRGLSRLADQLLSRALVIHRADAVARTRLDLRKIAIAASEEIDHDDAEAAAHLRLDLPQDAVWITGDTLTLVEATKNLVTNAFKYGLPPVTLCVRGTPTPTLQAIDHGSGIPEALWPEFGRRFARGGRTDIDGAGLGLAIVRSVAEAHAGTLAFSRPAPGTFAVSLILPPGKGARE
ncbi:sensor histidine kinase N-terminal domain-containing protein [Nisaea sp.]|uniref:sensor histidine kinase N-terminal domain-containing protein n=1 Tax=Nisaea sp. TaxID=2024842 RepID=UPI0032F01E42